MILGLLRGAFIKNNVEGFDYTQYNLFLFVISCLIISIMYMKYKKTTIRVNIVLYIIK